MPGNGDYSVNELPFDKIPKRSELFPIEKTYSTLNAVIDFMEEIKSIKEHSSIILLNRYKISQLTSFCECDRTHLVYGNIDLAHCQMCLQIIGVESELSAMATINCRKYNGFIMQSNQIFDQIRKRIFTTLLSHSTLKEMIAQYTHKPIQLIQQYMQKIGYIREDFLFDHRLRIDFLADLNLYCQLGNEQFAPTNIIAQLKCMLLFLPNIKLNALYQREYHLPIDLIPDQVIHESAVFDIAHKMRAMYYKMHLLNIFISHTQQATVFRISNRLIDDVLERYITKICKNAVKVDKLVIDTYDLSFLRLIAQDRQLLPNLKYFELTEISSTNLHKYVNAFPGCLVTIHLNSVSSGLIEVPNIIHLYQHKGSMAEISKSRAIEMHLESIEDAVSQLTIPETVVTLHFTKCFTFSMKLSQSSSLRQLIVINKTKKNTYSSTPSSYFDLSIYKPILESPQIRANMTFLKIKSTNTSFVNCMMLNNYRFTSLTTFSIKLDAICIESSYILNLLSTPSLTHFSFIAGIKLNRMDIPRIAQAIEKSKLQKWKLVSDNINNIEQNALLVGTTRCPTITSLGIKCFDDIAQSFAQIVKHFKVSHANIYKFNLVKPIKDIKPYCFLHIQSLRLKIGLLSDTADLIHLLIHRCPRLKSLKLGSLLIRFNNELKGILSPN